MRPRQFTDEQLLETARRCFLEHGPAVATSVIASELGVSQAALFKRIGTKDELFRRAFATQVLPSWSSEIEAGPDDRPVPEQLLELAIKIDAFFASLMPIMAIMRENRSCPRELFEHFDEPPPIRNHRALTGWLQRLHDRGLAHVPAPDATALAFLGSLHVRHTLQHFLGDSAPNGGPRYLQTLVDMIWAAISPRT